jgi:hypothetical protein
LERRLNLIRNIWHTSNRRNDDQKSLFKKDDAKSSKQNYFTLNNFKLNGQIASLIRNKLPAFENKGSLRIIKSSNSNNMPYSSSASNRLIKIFKNITSNDSTSGRYEKNLKLFNKLDDANKKIQMNNYSMMSYLDLCLINKNSITITSIKHSNSLPQVSEFYLSIIKQH